jgi:heme exporter protein A
MRLSAESLCIDRAGRRIISSASFSLAAGEALLVTGRNGAGKSTLLRALAGLLPIALGTLTFEAPAGCDPGTPLAELAHYLGPTDALKGTLTTAENLAFWTAMLGGENLSPAAALERMALQHTADISAAFLSTGQRRRAALARLLSCHRPVWLLDEPATALDSSAQASLALMFAHHRNEGGIIIAATHVPLNLPDAQVLALGDAP